MKCAARLGFIERLDDVAHSIHALINFENVLARDKRREPVPKIRVGEFHFVHAGSLTAQTANLERVGEAARGQNRGFSGVASEKSIQANGRAVAEPFNFGAELLERNSIRFGGNFYSVNDAAQHVRGCWSLKNARAPVTS